MIGGAIGSRVGQGRGQVAATAAGAYLGSKAGERLSDPDAPGITAGNVTGAIIGGAVGSQFGGGNGRLGATAAGAVIGSSVADRMDENTRRQGLRRPQRDVNNYDEEPGYAAPPQRYYRPSPQYLSSEPGAPVVIQGGGY
ncbi:MAG: glycine zipper 2TM domain-containing protein [Sulfuricella denitrificans]|nr:glycine zipper 2TM domain-containing protein [Sulfuricella denitrificans]